MYDIKNGLPANTTIANRLIVRPADTEGEVLKKAALFADENGSMVSTMRDQKKGDKKVLYVNGQFPPTDVFKAVEMALYGATLGSGKQIEVRGKIMGRAAGQFEEEPPGGSCSIPVGPVISEEPMFNPEEAATLIQAKFRGHQERKVPRAARHFIIAGPAAGKGAQCDRLVAQYGVVHVSTGDMLRAEVAKGSELGQQADALMKEGKLVPDELIIPVVKERLTEADCKKQGWLLDGFPRTEGQAQALVDAGIVATRFIQLVVAGTSSSWVTAVEGMYQSVMLVIDGERAPAIIFENIRRGVEETPWRIMINGPPGSGKGVQVENLVKKLGVQHLNTGGIVNKAMSAKGKKYSMLGAEAKTYVDKGKDIPDALLTKLVLEAITSEDVQKQGWCLDGFPRNAQQVEQLTRANVVPDRILLIDVPADALVPHMLSKRMDPETKKVYFTDDPGLDLPEEVRARLKDMGPRFTEEKIRESMEPYLSTKEAILVANPKKCCVVDGEGTQPSASGSASGKTAVEVWDGVCAALYGSALKAEERKASSEQAPP